MIDTRPDFEQCYYEVCEQNKMLVKNIEIRDNAIKKLNERIQQLEAEGSEIYNDRSMIQHINDLQQERINQLEAQLEESRAKEGKGCLETMFESLDQLFSTINEAMQGMTSEEIRELMRPDEEEEDHEEDRDTESE